MIERVGCVVVLLCVACDGGGLPAPAPLPATLAVVTDLSATGVAGASAGNWVVVVARGGIPVRGVIVNFATTMGSATIVPSIDTTDENGTASAAVVLGTTPGLNQVSATVSGLETLKSATVTTVPDVAQAVQFPARFVRFQPTQDSIQLAATPRDRFGNALSGPVTWRSRNPALVEVSSPDQVTYIARIVSRPGTTYLVATYGGVTDSVLVAVHDASSSPCAYLTAPLDLAVGASASFEAPGITCVRSGATAEYVVTAHYNTAVAFAAANVSIAAHGVSTPQSPFPGQPGGAAVVAADAPGADLDFESALRERERESLPQLLPAARAWYDTRARAGLKSLTAANQVGALTQLNVNAFDFCTKPALRTARVAAVTQGTIVLADTSNPVGGFTDEEYQAIAATMDTLIIPLETAAFGASTDIDHNGRIGILFTSAVNALTPRNAGSIVLGFYYSRDLLPKAASTGECPGSNAGEMFYVLVPDPGATVSDARSKAFVAGVAVSTVAHELQHLINASRRMYITRAPSVTEDSWLNEGLSHIAEELVFYRASQLSPRQNIDASQLAEGTLARQMADLYIRGNFGRLGVYIRATEANSPLSPNDVLATRGASWAFLRYIADRAGASDGDLWHRLVNSTTTGVVNLDARLASTGMTTLSALRDWSLALAADDAVSGLSAALSQASWNFISALSQLGFPNTPFMTTLPNATTTLLPLRAGGSAYLRFGVEAGREALIQVTSGGGFAPAGTRLTVMRIK